jgi:hypothetical protein
MPAICSIARFGFQDQEWEEKTVTSQSQGAIKSYQFMYLFGHLAMWILQAPFGLIIQKILYISSLAQPKYPIRLLTLP